MAPVTAAPTPSPAARRHWRRTRLLTLALLAVWAAVAFGATAFARELDFPFFGWPFDFWLAAQGGVIVFVVLVAVYARAMAHVDRALAREEPAQPDAAGEPR